jgi:hypothetical protein
VQVQAVQVVDRLVADGSALLVGPARLSRAFPTWFDVSYFSAGIRRRDLRRARDVSPA